jgi:anti-sigma-K factor RskA
MDYARPDRADALAAQYVTGTLRGPARRRFEALLPGHPALRAAVQRWQARLLPLADALPPQPPPARVWQGIEQRLWPRVAPPPPAPWWRSLPVWRGTAAAALLAAVVLGTLLSQPQPAPVVVVLQATEAGVASERFVASVSRDGRSLTARPLQPVSLQADRTLELWAVPPQGNPRSLGLVSATGTTVIERRRLPAALLDARQTAALAVSIEPAGGSPKGVPTGPVVFVGELKL